MKSYTDIKTIENTCKIESLGLKMKMKNNERYSFISYF